MRHTPGNWEAKFVTERGAAGGYFQIIADLPSGLNPNFGPYVIADTLNCHHCVEHHTDGMQTEERANSILMAAAPELLAACNAAWLVESQIGQHDRLIAILSKAIAKAEGRAS